MTYRANLADCLKKQGEALARSGQLKAAQAATTEAISHFHALSSRFPKQYHFIVKECECCQDLAEFLESERNLPKALEWMRRGLKQFQDSAARDPTDPTHQTHLAHSHSRLGQLLDDAVQPAAARVELEQARDILTPLADRPFPGQPVARYNLARTLGVLGLTYAKLNRPADGEKTMLVAQELFEQFTREAPAVRDYRLNRSANEHNLAVFYLGLSRLDDAEHWGLAAIRTRKALHADFRKDSVVAVELAKSYLHQVKLASKQKNPEGRLRWYGETVKFLRRFVEASPSAAAKDRLARAAGARGQLLVELGKLSEALPDFDLAVAHAVGDVLEIVRADRALCRVRLGDWQGAAADCAAAPAAKDPLQEFRYARACALCHDLAARDPSLTESERQTQAERLAAQALTRLARLRAPDAKKNAALRQQLQTDADFSHLRERKDFQSFINSL
ncbi:MAG: hypothetical protein L0Y71_17575 [Gemmataceae bacterium]|nr:hypothetical protein [Gemmataceae bacterium]